MKTWSEDDRVAVFVDLHNPGPNDGEAFFFVAPDEASSPRADRAVSAS